MSNLNANEQLMLELINRARLDPAAEAKRQHISLNEGVSSSHKISTSSKQALAANDILNGTADHHSSWMLSHDKFQHEEGSLDPGERMANAGYDWDSWGENISWTGTTGKLDAAAAIKSQFDDLFVDSGEAGRGHRLNILDADFREVGVGQKTGSFTTQGHTYHSSMVTQDFGARGSDVFITGVVYRDTVKNDDFFTIGEQRTGVGVSAANGGSPVADTTGSGGGYELAVAPSSGQWTMNFGGGASVLVSVGSANVKLDLVNSHEIWTSNSTASLSATITSLHALGLGNITLTGSDVAERLTGNKGKNGLVGNDGADSLTGGAGADKLTGGLGDDHFVYNSTGDSGTTSATRDTINDFDQAGDDLIDLSALSGTYAWRGTSGFTAAHQVRVTATADGVLVHVSTDADHTDEMQIFLAGAHIADISKGDFIL